MQSSGLHPTPISAKRLSISEGLGIFLILCLTTFVCEFASFKSFGLYEDDYWFIAGGMRLRGSGLLNLILNCITHWPQGRPIAHFFAHAFGFFGNQLGGLSALYLYASLWLSFNGWLTFKIARHWLPLGPAFISGLIFVLFPAETGRQATTYIILQGAMSAMLLGCLYWLRTDSKRYFSYLLALACPLMFETSLLPFLALPLLGRPSNKIGVKRMWLEHILACTAIVVFVGALRIHLGENRMLGVLGSPSQSLYKAFSSTVIGPWTVLKAAQYALHTGYLELTAAGSLVGALLLGVLYRLLYKRLVENKPLPSFSGIPFGLACFIAWCGSYLFTLVDYPPIQIVGRMTDTHMAGAFPFALLCGSLVCLGLKNSKLVKTVTCLCLGFLIVGFSSYGFHIQRGYVQSLKLQRIFWQQILDLCPDAGKQTQIFVIGRPAQERQDHVVLTNSWSDCYTCRVLFEDTTDLDAPDSIEFGHLGVNPELWDFQINQGTVIGWKPRFWRQTSYSSIKQDHLILIYSDNGRLVRVGSLQFEMRDNAGKPMLIKIASTRPIPKPVPNTQPKTALFVDLWDRAQK
jgi:hypothetical protein